jgi:hypothetical protein
MGFTRLPLDACGFKGLGPTRFDRDCSMRLASTASQHELHGMRVLAP